MTALMLLLVAAFVLALLGVAEPYRRATNAAVLCVVVYLLLLSHGR